MSNTDALAASPTSIKVCGITRPIDALACAAAGVDSIGLVFTDRSPRYVSHKQAQALIAMLPPFMNVVGLFLNPSAAEVKDVLSAVSLNTLQFHGEETPEFCAQFERPWLKALAMGDANHDASWLAAESKRYAAARAVLLDSHQTGAQGGTGKAFNWHNVPRQLARRVVLAGGLNPENVADAIARVRPAAVDLSSGVELEPGIKDAEKIHALVAAVRAAVRAADAERATQLPRS